MSVFTLRTRPAISILGGALGLVCLCAAVCGIRVAYAQSSSGPAQASATKLSKQEFRGEGLFLQRCSLCHLPRKLKFGSPPVVGPNLGGLFKEADPDQQKFLRGFILKGDANMPGFQYGLDTQEVDDLIAYLKTL